MSEALHNFTLTYNHSQLYFFVNSATHSPVYKSSPESATRAASSTNKSWFISNLPPFSRCRSSPFPRTLALIVHPHIKQPSLRHHTTPSQSNIENLIYSQSSWLKPHVTKGTFHTRNVPVARGAGGHKCKPAGCHPATQLA